MNKELQQRTFDVVYSGLKSQGFQRCQNGNGLCLMSDGQGHHCAMGWIDPETFDRLAPEDPRQSEGVEGASALSLKVAELKRDSLNLAFELLQAHDKSYGPADMKSKLIALAKRWGLTVPTE